MFKLSNTDISVMTREENEEAFITDEKTGSDLVLEKILSKFRPLGPFYLKLMPFLMFSSMTNAMYCMNYVFAVKSVNYRCKYECEDKYMMSAPALNLTLTGGPCFKYPDVIYSDGTCSSDNFNTSYVLECEEWVYDEPDSFVAEFQLGCQDWKRTLVGTAHSFGYMLGLLLLGPLSDKFGRKKMIVFSGFIGALLGLSRSIMISYWGYVILEFLEALMGDTYSQNYMLGVEMVTKENRVLFASLMIGSMSVAGTFVALTAWLVLYWRYYLRVIYAFSLLYILHAFFMDESVRWLLIKGRKDEAKKILRKAAKTSNVYVSEEMLNNIYCERSEASIDLISLIKLTIKSKKLLLRFFACACMWITATFSKYTLMINSVSLEGNKYVNYALAAFFDLPASIALALILLRYKRKKPLIFSFLMAGLLCVIQSVIPKGNAALSLSLYLLGKFSIAISYAIVYLYTTELFPTYKRNTMHALCSSIGRIGSILAPQTPLLIRFWTGFPSVIIGSLSLITGGIIMLLPDTAEDILPDTVQQAEALGSKPAVKLRNTSNM